MKTNNKTFYERCISGEIPESEVEKVFHQQIRSWCNHKNPGMFLFEFLGMSQSLFEVVDENPKILHEIVRNRDKTKIKNKDYDKINKFIKDSFTINENGDMFRIVKYPSVEGPVFNKMRKEDLLDLCDFVYSLKPKKIGKG